MVGKMVRVILAGALALTVATAAPAAARGTDVVKRGTCSSGSDWKLKLSKDNGKIQVEYEVDSGIVGQTWRVRVFRNDVRIFGGRVRTKAPSGSFTVRTLANNPPGTDHYRARAVNVNNGEVCTGRAAI